MGRNRVPTGHRIPAKGNALVSHPRRRWSHEREIPRVPTEHRILDAMFSGVAPQADMQPPLWGEAMSQRDT
ncbi:MAG: hypothetical protein KGQ16_02755, partial [Cyanobacteria bacterium REEB444]|nr:hypothetical protein [Cyanobacteria bacterium REEB444]